MAAPADLSRLQIRRDAPRPKQSHLLRNVFIVLPVIGLAAAAWFYGMRPAGPVVQVVSATASATGGTAGDGGTTSVTANGYVVARTKASVSAKTPGRLAYLGVAEGSTVREGTVIARLDNADFLAAIAQAEANVASAEANVIEAKAERDQAVRELTRQRDIRAQQAMLVSQAEVDVAASRAEGAEARFGAAVARRRAAESGVRLARANNENTVIRAPFTGTVLRKDAEVGEVVAPSMGGGLTRGAVVTMADLTTLEVEVDVNEAYIARVRGGMGARITLDAYPDTSFRGSVRQVVPTADRQRATVLVKVAITDRDTRILPEMGAKVDFIEPDTTPAVARSAAPSGFRVPAAAVRNEAGKPVVWIVREGRLTRREVTTGPVSSGFLEIRSGLSGGEQLLVGGVERPVDGMRVTVQGG